MRPSVGRKITRVSDEWTPCHYHFIGGILVEFIRPTTVSTTTPGKLVGNCRKPHETVADGGR